MAAYHPHVEWDSSDRVSWFYFYRDDMRDWVFYTDKRGFQERLTLVRDRGIQGFCSVGARLRSPRDLVVTAISQISWIA